MISANGGLRAHRDTPQVTQRWPRGSEPASARQLAHGTKDTPCNGSSDSTQLYTDVIRISMILRCTLVQ